MHSHYKCSFCGASELEAKKIVAKGTKDDSAICSECIVLCVDALINVAEVKDLSPNSPEKKSDSDFKVPADLVEANLESGSTEKKPATEQTLQGSKGMDISFPCAPRLGSF